MAVEGEGDDVLAYTKVWLDKINRGDLFPLSDEAFHYFVQVELCVRTFLLHHVLTRPNDNWTLLSQDIDEPKDAELFTRRNYQVMGYS